MVIYLFDLLHILGSVAECPSHPPWSWRSSCPLQCSWRCKGARVPCISSSDKALSRKTNTSRIPVFVVMCLLFSRLYTGEASNTDSFRAMPVYSISLKRDDSHLRVLHCNSVYVLTSMRTGVYMELPLQPVPGWIWSRRSRVWPFSCSFLRDLSPHWTPRDMTRELIYKKQELRLRFTIAPYVHEQ